MNRKQLEDSAWAKTPKDERRSQKERYDWRTQKTIVERLKGNAREVRVFDPSGSTEETLSPWMPLWGLYSDELEQRSKEEREPKLRPPYSRGRSDYTGDVESSPVTRRHSTVKSKPSKKSPAQLQREIDEALSQPATSSSVRLPPGEPAAWAHRHLSKANTLSELEEIWHVMRKSGTGMGAYYASRTGIAQSEINSVYQQHRTRLGEAGSRSHSTVKHPPGDPRRYPGYAIASSDRGDDAYFRSKDAALRAAKRLANEKKRRVEVARITKNQDRHVVDEVYPSGW